MKRQTVVYIDGWFIASKPSEKVIETEDFNPEGWFFDTNFFKEFPYKEKGSIVVFKFVKGKEEKYIHWYNHRGFRFKKSDIVITPDNIEIYEAS